MIEKDEQIFEVKLARQSSNGQWKSSVQEVRLKPSTRMYGGGYPKAINPHPAFNSRTAKTRKVIARQAFIKVHEEGHQLSFNFTSGTGVEQQVKEVFIAAGYAVTEGSPEPPKFGEYLLYLCIPKVEREVLLGDLAEEYPALVARFGYKWAQVYFYKQVTWSIWPLIRKAIVRWGLFGWVVELIRRISL